MPHCPIVALSSATNTSALPVSLVGPGQFDVVVGLLVDVGLVGVVGQQGHVADDHVGDHIPGLPEGQSVSIIEQYIDVPGVEQGLLDGFPRISRQLSSSL